jgi:hypothetical protein
VQCSAVQCRHRSLVKRVRLHLHGRSVSQARIKQPCFTFSTLKIEAKHSSHLPDYTWRHIPEDTNLQVQHAAVEIAGLKKSVSLRLETHRPTQRHMLTNITAITAEGNHRLKDMARTEHADTGSVLQTTVSSILVFICTLLHDLR